MAQPISQTVDDKHLSKADLARRFQTMTAIFQKLENSGILHVKKDKLGHDRDTEDSDQKEAFRFIQAYCNSLVRRPGEVVAAVVDMHSEVIPLVVTTNSVLSGESQTPPSYKDLLPSAQANVYDFASQYSARGALPFATHAMIASQLLADYYNKPADNVDKPLLKTKFEHYIVAMGLKKAEQRFSKSQQSFDFLDRGAAPGDFPIDSGLSSKAAQNKFDYWRDLDLSDQELGSSKLGRLINQQVATKASKDIENITKNSVGIPIIPLTANIANAVQALLKSTVGSLHKGNSLRPATAESIKLDVLRQMLLRDLLYDLKSTILAYLSSIAPSNFTTQIGKSYPEWTLHLLRCITIHASSAAHLISLTSTTTVISKKLSVEVYKVDTAKVTIEPWKETFKAVLGGGGSTYDIIGNIETIFTPRPPSTDKTIFLNDKMKHFPYHCELSLASWIAKAKKDGFASLSETTKIFGKFIGAKELKIGVSKSCCPICALVLDLLLPDLHLGSKDSHSNPIFRARSHSHIYQCSLPPECWDRVGKDVYNKLITLFREKLGSKEFCDKLKHLASKNVDLSGTKTLHVSERTTETNPPDEYEFKEVVEDLEIPAEPLKKTDSGSGK